MWSASLLQTGVAGSGTRLKPNESDDGKYETVFAAAFFFEQSVELLLEPFWMDERPVRVHRSTPPATDNRWRVRACCTGNPSAL